MELSGISMILGGEKVLQKKIRGPMDLIELSYQGISKLEFSVCR